MALQPIEPYFEEDGAFAQADGQFVPIEERDEWQAYIAMVKRDKQIRLALTVFTGLLVVIAPIIAYSYPSAWNLILSTALAFTIGTNLLISVVTVKVEGKAQSLEERMEKMIQELNDTAERMSGLHKTLNIANIPGAVDLFETVREEFIPGIRSLQDLDLESITMEVKRASQFVDTLDREKLFNLINQFTKEDVPAGANPYSDAHVVEEFDESPPSKKRLIFDKEEFLASLQA